MNREIETLILKGMELSHLVLWGDLPGAGRVFSMMSDEISEHMEPVSILCKLSLPNTEIEFWADVRVVRQNSEKHGLINRLYAVSKYPALKEVDNFSGGRVRILDVRPLEADSVISKIKVY